MDIVAVITSTINRQRPDLVKWTTQLLIPREIAKDIVPPARRRSGYQGVALNAEGRLEPTHVQIILASHFQTLLGRSLVAFAGWKELQAIVEGLTHG